MSSSSLPWSIGGSSDAECARFPLLRRGLTLEEMDSLLFLDLSECRRLTDDCLLLLPNSITALRLAQCEKIGDKVRWATPSLRFSSHSRPPGRSVQELVARRPFLELAWSRAGPGQHFQQSHVTAQP